MLFLKTPFNLRVSELLEKVRNNKMGWSMLNQNLDLKFQPENKELAIQLAQEFSDIVTLIEITESQIFLNLKERYTCLFP